MRFRLPSSSLEPPVLLALRWPLARLPSARSGCRGHGPGQCLHRDSGQPSADLLQSRRHHATGRVESLGAACTASTSTNNTIRSTERKAPRLHGSRALPGRAAVLPVLSSEGSAILLWPRHLFPVWIEDGVAGRRLLPPGGRLRQPRISSLSTRVRRPDHPVALLRPRHLRQLHRRRAAPGAHPEQGDSFSFKGNGLSVGGNAGILWKPTERQSIGLSYHSPVSGDLTGHTRRASTAPSAPNPRPGTRRSPPARSNSKRDIAA